jgi:phosphoadenosine phosphosulfate reductase
VLHLTAMATHAPEIEALAADHGAESLTAQQVVEAMVARFGGRVALACSFQKEEAVLLDLLLKADPHARVFALDTGVLFPETYDAWRAVEKRYGIQVEAVQGPTLGYQQAAHGDRLWETKPDLCCAIRKVEPLTRKLGELDAWIVGIRRDQSPTRAGAQKIAWDASFEIWKAAPLADWSDDRVWDYIREHELPVNPLHEQGYSSIGCTYCTKPGAGRDGRWAGKEKTECGLHRPLA